MNTKELSPKFRKLTMEKLVAWAGEENAERGKVEMEYVRRLGRMPDGGILASVAGIKDHVAFMWFDKAGELHSECTCTEATNCHHAVSILLRCVEMLKAGDELPLIDSTDERIRALDESADEEVVEKRKGRVRKGDVEGYLATLSKEELTALLLSYLNSNPSEKKKLIEKIDLNGSNDKGLIHRVTKEIQKLQESLTKREATETTGRAPDISKLTKILENLYERGYYNEVADLGLALKRVCFGLDKWSGSSACTAIVRPLDKCSKTITNARMKCNKGKAESLLWDILFFDGYHWYALNHVNSVIDAPLLTTQKETWSDVADKLEELITPQTRPDYPLNRELLYKALKRADRQDEIVEKTEKLLISYHDYRQFIDQLTSAHQYEKAEMLCRKAIQPESSLCNWEKRHMETTLESILCSLKRPISRASIRAKWFFENHKIDDYIELETICEKEGIWTVVRKGCLEFVQSGNLPDASTWPLEPISLQAIILDCEDFPKPTLRMEIALWEGDCSAIYETYQKIKTDSEYDYFRIRNEEKILLALEKDYPFETLQDYVRLVEEKCKYILFSISDSVFYLLKHIYSLCSDTHHMDVWKKVSLQCISRVTMSENAQKIMRDIESGKYSK